MNQKTKQQHE